MHRWRCDVLRGRTVQAERKWFPSVVASPKSYVASPLLNHMDQRSMSMPRSSTLLQSHTLGGLLTEEASYSVGAERFLPHRTWFPFCGLSPVIKPTFNVNCEIIDTSRRTLPFPRSSLLPGMKRFSWILSANLVFFLWSSLLLQSYHTNKILSHS